MARFRKTRTTVGCEGEFRRVVKWEGEGFEDGFGYWEGGFGRHCCGEEAWDDAMELRYLIDWRMVVSEETAPCIVLDSRWRVGCAIFICVLLMG